MQDLRMIFRYGKPYRRDCFAAVGLVFIECVFSSLRIKHDKFTGQYAR